MLSPSEYNLVHVQDLNCVCEACCAAEPVDPDRPSPDEAFGQFLRKILAAGDDLTGDTDGAPRPVDTFRAVGERLGLESDADIRAILTELRARFDAGEIFFVSGQVLRLEDLFAEQSATAGPSGFYDTDLNDADQFLDGLTGGPKWEQSTLSYSFATSPSDYQDNYIGSTYADTASELTEAAKTFVRNSFDEYASVINLTYVEFSENSQTGTAGARIIDADLRFAETENAGTALAYYPSDNNVGGDSFYNSTRFTAPEIGTYAGHTYLHELGHAHGLKHGHDTNLPGALPTEWDSMEFTVMTYRSFIDAPLNGYRNETNGYAQSLMMLDVAALQRMYGANFDTNTGDTVYSFSTTTGEMFVDGIGTGTPAGNRVFRTLWDGDGTDTYDFSNYTTNMAIDLSPGGWSDFDTVGVFQNARLGSVDGASVYARAHLFNAMQYQDDARSLIENANGGTGNDSFVGNAANNVFAGNGGDDSFFDSAGADTYLGGSGTDEVFFDQSFSTYSFSIGGAFLQVANTAVDLVENTLEWLSFSDVRYTFQQVVDLLDPGGNTPPVANDDTARVDEEAALVIDVLANDTDADGTALGVSRVGGQAISAGGSVSLASGAIVTLLADGRLSYDQNGAFGALDVGQTATDVFTYTVTDGLATNDASVSVTIDGTFDNTPPVAGDDTGTVAEDGIFSGAVLSNDSDANGDALSVTSVAGGAVGQAITLTSGARVTMQADGTYTYDPNGAFDTLTNGETATDTFTYVVSDGRGGADTGTVTITVNGLSGTIVTEELTVDFEAFPDGAYPGQGDLSASGVTVASFGGSNVGLIDGQAEFFVDGGSLSFDRATFAAVSGRTRVSVEALDDSGQVVGSVNLNLRSGREVTRDFDTLFDGATMVVITSSGPVAIDDILVVTRVEGEVGDNLAPSARMDTFAIAEGGALAGNLLDDNGSGADSDPDGDPVQVIAVEGTAGGTVSLASGATVTFAADGTFSYQQNGAFDALYDGQTGTDSFSYSISDGNGGTDTGLVVIDIQGSGTPPPPPVETSLDFSTDPNVDGFVFQDIQLVTSSGDGEARSIGDSLTLVRADGETFGFQSGFVRAVTGKNVDAILQGYDDGVLVVEETIRMRNKGDTEIPANDPRWDAIDQLTITASGGVYIDDFTLLG